MNILQNTTIISVLSISTAHGTTVSDLFRYPIETVNSKYGRKEKRGVKFEKKIRNDYINKRFPGLSTENLPSNVLLYQLDEKENSEFAFFFDSHVCIKLSNFPFRSFSSSKTLALEDSILL